MLLLAPKMFSGGGLVILGRYLQAHTVYPRCWDDVGRKSSTTAGLSLASSNMLPPYAVLLPTLVRPGTPSATSKRTNAETHRSIIALVMRVRSALWLANMRLVTARLISSPTCEA